MNLSENKTEDVSNLDTPCLLIDIDLLEKNLTFMQSHTDKAGKSLRPHVKTHKCSQLAQLQRNKGAIGLCVAKVSEACKLVAEGMNDVLITSPVVTEYKILRLFECLQKALALMVVVDNQENVRQLNRHAIERHANLNVLVDIDPGLGRTGVNYDNALEMGHLVHNCQGLTLKGIQCYAGQLQHVASYEDRKKRSIDTMQQAGRIMAQFKSAGLPCEILTGTGTGTFDIDSLVPELTELQVGSYALMDAEYKAIGSAVSEQFETFSPALSILTTVISDNHSANGWVTVDAGLKAIYHHGAKPIVMGHHAGPITYDWFGDEQGKLMGTPAFLPRLGEKVQLMVSHCDPTVNLFDKFYVSRNGKIIDVWPIDLRGCCQ